MTCSDMGNASGCSHVSKSSTVVANGTFSILITGHKGAWSIDEVDGPFHRVKSTLR